MGLAVCLHTVADRCEALSDEGQANETERSALEASNRFQPLSFRCLLDEFDEDGTRAVVVNGVLTFAATCPDQR